ncbi:hypothetical protein ACQ856_30230 (plasmid) [Mycolicibacterium psychrotolerans]|uniref:hypothetical protein n=1 Tax=Mycolicibacterium psychrotolerans TaxID=216929 RepID=UPI003D66B929
MRGRQQESRTKPALITGLGLIMVIAGFFQYYFGATTPGIIGMASGAVFTLQGIYLLARRRPPTR